MSRRSGQAITEFIVAIIAVMVLSACLVQLGVMSTVHTRVMTKARQEAGEHVVSPWLGAGTPSYLSQWTDGADDANYTVDDVPKPGDPAELEVKLVDYSKPGELAATVGANPVTELSADPSVAMDGFVRGHSSQKVPLLPVVKHMVYADDAINVESEVWMVTGSDLY